MQKIISLFMRDYVGERLIYDEYVEGTEWVVNGEGIATEKFDGTSCLLQDGFLYKRYDAKGGKPTPKGFIPAQEAPDPVTGHYPGWVLVDFDLPENKWHKQGYLWLYDNFDEDDVADGTYELVGLKVQGNPYNLSGHELWKHTSKWLFKVPCDFEGLKEYLTENKMEGIVWHHPVDKRMVKVKAKDFGIAWGKG